MESKEPKEYFEQLMKIINNNESNTLTLDLRDLSVPQFEQICDAISKSKIEKLNITTGQLDRDGQLDVEQNKKLEPMYKKLAAMLKENNNIESLILSLWRKRTFDDEKEMIEEYELWKPGLGGMLESLEYMEVARVNLRTATTLLSEQGNEQGFESLVEALKKNTGIKSLTLCGLNDAGVQAICGALTPTFTKGIANKEAINSTITSLSISAKDVDEKGARALGDMISANLTSLEVLNLCGSVYSSKCMPEIARGLAVNSNLETLILTSVIFSTERKPPFPPRDEQRDKIETSRRMKEAVQNQGVLAEALVSNKTREKPLALHLEGTEVFPDGAEAIAKTFKANPKIKTLNLRRNLIGKEGAIALAKALKTNTTIETLDLSNADLTLETRKPSKDLSEEDQYVRTSHVSAKVAEDIASLIVTNHSIETLKLGQNKFFEGTKAIVKALENNNTIKRLDLTHTGLDDGAAVELAKVIATNKTIETLELANNHFHKDGAIAIANALAKNTKIHTLDLRGGMFKKISTIALANALAKNHTITTLSLSCGALSLKEITNVLIPVLDKDTGEKLKPQKNTTLQTLNIAPVADLRDGAFSQELVSEITSEIIKLLQANQSLQTLSIQTTRDSRFSINPTQAGQIADALKINHSIIELNLPFSPATGDETMNSIRESLNNNKLERVRQEGQEVDVHLFTDVANITKSFIGKEHAALFSGPGRKAAGAGTASSKDKKEEEETKEREEHEPRKK